MNEPRTRIPTPLYAAAGAGELAYRQLRKLPSVVTGLSGRAVTTAAALRTRATAGAAELDLDRLRAVAMRNAALVVTGAQAAQERAVTAYNALIIRGERVVGSGVVQAADTVNTDLIATEKPVTIEEPTTPATVAEQVREAPQTTRAKRVTPTSAAAAGTPAKTTKTTKTTKATKPTTATRRTRPAGTTE